MSLIFHGKLSRHVKEGFEGNSQYDTLAEFPFGFFSDIMVVNKKGENNMYEAIYNLALLETDTVPAFPQFTVRFVTPKQPSSEPSTPSSTEPSTETITLTPKEQKIQDRYRFLKNITDIKIVKDRIAQFRNILEQLEKKCFYIADGLATCKNIKSLDDLIKEANRIAQNRLNYIRTTTDLDYAINNQLDAAIKIESNNITTIRTEIQMQLLDKLKKLKVVQGHIGELKLSPLNELNTANTYKVTQHIELSDGTQLDPIVVGNFTIILNDQNELVITEVLDTDNVVGTTDTTETTDTTGEITVKTDAMVEDIKNVIKEAVKSEDVEKYLIDDNIKDEIASTMPGYNSTINIFPNIDKYKETIIAAAQSYALNELKIEIQILDNIINNIKCNIG